MQLNYIAIVHKDDGSDYGVSFPDFPGCVSAGSTLAEAHEGAAEALMLHIKGMQEDGEPIPEPLPIRALRGAAVVLSVSVDIEED